MRSKMIRRRWDGGLIRGEVVVRIEFFQAFVFQVRVDKQGQFWKLVDSLILSVIGACRESFVVSRACVVRCVVLWQSDLRWIRLDNRLLLLLFGNFPFRKWRLRSDLLLSSHGDIRQYFCWGPSRHVPFQRRGSMTLDHRLLVGKWVHEPCVLFCDLNLLRVHFRRSGRWRTLS
jgi:hypothetical protein